ncbi:hypothetical protein M0Q50_01970 [bacterium]|jgi:uncharacterized membrane protein|nr:hypothetical protein [bacterium]
MKKNYKNKGMILSVITLITLGIGVFNDLLSNYIFILISIVLFSLVMFMSFKDNDEKNVSFDDIKKRAEEIYDETGNTNDVENWLQAENELKIID